MENQLDELRAIYEDVNQAFQNKDLDGITKYISPDWTGEFGGGAVTRDPLVENVRNQLQNFDEISWPRTISHPRTDGNKLTVRAEGPYKAVKADSREPIQMDLANEDTWQKGPNGWQNIYSKALEP